MEGTMYRRNIVQYQELLKDVQKLDQAGAANNKFGFESMSRDEALLDERMGSIRKKYRDRYESMARPYPSIEPFYSVKEQIKKGKLYKEVFRKMPKGGLLHVHSAAGLSVEGLLRLIKDWNRMHGEDNLKIYVVTAKKPEYPDVEVGTLLFGKQVRLEMKARKKSVPLTVEKADEFLKEEGNEEWLTELLSFGSYSTRWYYYRWDFFNIIFARTTRLFHNAEFYKDYHVRFFLECIEDNIHYVELRCGFEEFEDFSKSGQSEESAELKKNISDGGLMVTERLAMDADCNALNYMAKKDAALQVAPWDDLNKVAFLDKIVEAQIEANLQKLHEEIYVKVILCARRSLDISDPVQKNSLLKKLDSAIMIAQTTSYKSFVIGFDFVSEEDRGQTTNSYAKDIIYGKVFENYELTSQEEIDKLERLKESEDEDVKRLVGHPRIELIDFYPHDGESSWNSNDNVISAAIISQYRIGHGFHMDKHPGCVRTIATNNGAINATPRYPVLEICPISNQLLGYYPDLRTHPAYQLLHQGIICCIANDDPQIFRNEGLSYDFWEAYMAWDLSLLDIKAMVYMAYWTYYKRAIDARATDDTVKGKFKSEWEGFVEAAISALQNE